MAMKVPVKTLKVFRDRETGNVVILRPDGFYATMEPESYNEDYLDYVAKVGGGLPPNPMWHYPVSRRIYMKF